MRENKENRQPPSLKRTDIHFLPTIQNIKMLVSKHKSTDPPSLTRHRSIEDILEAKIHTCPKIEINEHLHPMTETTQINTYNKYEYLPKIYLKKNRKAEGRREDAKEAVVVGGCGGVKGREEEGSGREGDGGQESSSNFSNSFYLQHFKDRVRKELQKQQFKLSYNLSEKVLMMSPGCSDDILQTFPYEQTNKNKYTKLITENVEEETERQFNLQKIPPEFMRIIDPHRPIPLHN